MALDIHHSKHYSIAFYITEYLLLTYKNNNWKMFHNTNISVFKFTQSIS